MTVNTSLKLQGEIRRRFRTSFFGAAVIIAAGALLVMTASGAAAQVAPGNSSPSPSSPTSPAASQASSQAASQPGSPAFLAQVSQLLQRLQRQVQLPPERTQSKLLPLLPDSTTFYGAFPNYGDAVHQALTIFHGDLEQDAELREWWRQTKPKAGGPMMEEYLDRYYQLSQYLGDEVVVSVSLDDRKEPSFVIVTEVRKPGVKEILAQMAKGFSDASNLSARIYDPQELATAKAAPGEQKLAILVRPDYVVAALDVPTLRRYNAQLDKGITGFATGPFGQRVSQAYESGATVVGAIDVQKLISLFLSEKKQANQMLEHSGFSDAKYLVWQHRSTPGRVASEMELSFTGPRRGIASWLAAPGPLATLDFVSPAPTIALSARLKNPAEIFDDLSALATASNPRSLDGLTQIENTLNVNLRTDLFSQLSGEIAMEMDTPGSNPKWRAILKVVDAARLQATLDLVTTAMHMSVQRSDEQGISYRTFIIPAPQKAAPISYAFFDGYWIIASSRESVAEAIRVHQSGESLAKSKEFQASLPPPPLAEASAVFYEDAAAMTAFGLKQSSPQMADMLSQAATEKTPIVMCVYGDENAVREASMNRGTDVGAVMVMAAIAIPNLLRARMAANEGAAAASVRTVNTAEIIYASTYPARGYARDLASLGPDPGAVNVHSAAHASLLDRSLGGAGCTGDNWCEKSGFRFRVRAECTGPKCKEYVVQGTPIGTSTGVRSFCSTSDGVVRVSYGVRPDSSLSASECRAWRPLQ